MRRGAGWREPRAFVTVVFALASFLCASAGWGIPKAAAQDADPAGAGTAAAAAQGTPPSPAATPPPAAPTPAPVPTVEAARTAEPVPAVEAARTAEPVPVVAPPAASPEPVVEAVRAVEPAPAKAVEPAPTVDPAAADPASTAETSPPADPAAPADSAAPVDEAAAQERRTRVEALAQEAKDVAHGNEAADALLQRVMTELSALRPLVERAIADANAATSADAPTPAWAVEVLADEETLDATRVLLLHRLTHTGRDAALGVDRAGLEQLRAEVWHIETRARWSFARRDALRGELFEAFGDPFNIAALSVRGGLVLVVLVLAALAASKRQRLLDSGRSILLRAVRRPRLQRVVERVHGVVSVLSGPLLFLFLLWGFHWALGPTVMHLHAVALIYDLLVWYAVYRIVIVALERLVAARAGSPSTLFGPPLGGKILSAVRTVGRYALFVAFVRMIVQFVAGPGYLHHAVGRIASLGTLVVIWVLMRRFRDDICDAYLRRHDTGALASAVRATRHKWYGFFVALIAFLSLALAALGRWLRSFLLGFEQSHRLLAFLFRRRLEKRLGANGNDASLSDDPDLPAELLADLPEVPIEDPAKGLDYYPDLDRFEELLAAWKDSPRIGSLLLVGGAGSGKTSWLRAAERAAGDIPSQRIALKQRMLTPEAVVSTLGAALAAPPEALADPHALAAWLRKQPRRLLILDDLEHLFLRGLDTWGAWEAFLDIVEYSAPSMFWLCALAEHPHRFVLFARGEIPVFRAVVELEPWPEEKLGELLGGRVRASGYELSFDDLMTDDEDPDPAAQAAGTERDFRRLIWDYAQGCPRVALHYWLRSLQVAGERRLRVKLFRGPSEDTLEDLGEVERFVLASVVWHDSLTPQEASLSLSFPRLPCEDALAKLLELGVVDDHGGRHRVTTPWQSAVTSFLLRKHLIQP
ncbi:hypothetical protein [Chondromyces crocatus]|uniref:Uncharacterized protein n=1 Tax=Chondromyces crocatus TaxID=52 RepID=A0A0K1EA97_CHOCO|nr:hypothetical protein [Chondromyces crocatus]AKT37795.1 uncharacterized protein CMC5_019370 [Chondromyces crocatus]